MIFNNKILNKLPKDMKEIITQLKKSKNKEECLKKAYNFLTKKYQGNRFKTYTHLPDLFLGLDKIWKKKGFLHCTNQNYLMKILLIKSGFFKDKDIKLKWTLINFISPHQYLKIKLNNKYINVDLWGKVYGIKIGNYAHGFNINKKKKDI